MNEKGKQDALLAGKAFRSRLCSLCLYSDLLRARETAEIIDAVSKEHSINVTVSAVSQPIEGADANIVSSNTDNINSPSDIPHLSCPELREVNYGVR